MIEERIDDAGSVEQANEPSLREVLQDAVAKQKDAGAAAAPEQAETAPAHETDEAKAARLRDAAGKFAKSPEKPEGSEKAAVDPNADGVDSAKEAPSAHRPPPGFSVQSKADWDKLPEHVRADIAKREAEVDAGFKRYSGLGKYAQEAEKNGTTLQTAVDDYYAIEQGLRKDFLGGLEAICQRFGVDPRALTTAMGQRYGLAPGQQQQRQAAPPQQQQIDPRQIEDRAVQRFREEMEGREINQQIAAFSADTKNRYFENVKNDMALLLQNGKAGSLKEAYDAACWLHPEIRTMLLKEQSAAPNNAAAATQARAAAKAVGGAPSAGFNPSDKPAYNPNETTRDTIVAAVRAQKARA